MKKSKDWSSKQKETVSYKKLLRHFESLTEENAFLNEVSAMRKEYKLPSKGVDAKEDIFHSYFADVDLWIAFQVDVRGMAKKYGLSWSWMRETLRDYIIYNQIVEPATGVVAGISLVDLQHFLKKDKFWIQKQANDFPIAICIHPYASQRDVLDFVKKNFKDVIEKGLKKHRDPDVSIGKKRRKSQRVRERNEFICKNKDLEVGKIWSLVANEFGDDLDFGTIYKIIKECENLSVHR